MKARMIGRMILGGLLSITCQSILAAEPYVVPPPYPSNANCPTDKIAIPESATSVYYRSDDCKTIFIGPPSVIDVTLPAVFSGISSGECQGLDALIEAGVDINKKRGEVASNLINGDISLDEATTAKARIRLAQQFVDEGLEGDYQTFGAKTAVSLRLDWDGNVRAYKAANPKYDVLHLPTAAGIVTFEEALVPEEFELFGLHENAIKSPVLEYTISGLPPISTDSDLLEEGKLPVFFPIVRAERAGFRQIEFGGGGVTGSVTFNKVGYCRYRDEGQNPVAFMTPTITYAMALKTYGSYEIKISVEYLLKVLESLRSTTVGTASASAVSDDFFQNESDQTIKVTLNQDLKNALTNVQRDAFKQNILYDVATQFLSAVSGDAASKKNVVLPEVQNVDRYKTIVKINRVCRRKSGFLGIGSSRRCWDQAYNVKVLQNTQQYQEARARVEGRFDGTHTVKTSTYVLVPWNSSL
ncbi:MAG: hypothetical protein AB2809_20020 [Candidatus Thiodiazotropha sp.]